jgi:TonB family protein
LTSINTLREDAKAMKAKQFLMIAAILLAGSASAQQTDNPKPRRVQLPETVAMNNLAEVAAPRRPDAVGAKGKVVLQIVIDQEGKLQEAKVLSGHPLLAQASLEAVQQWKFRPFHQNDAPVEVETMVTIEFIDEPPYVMTPKPAPPHQTRIKVASGVMQGLRIHKVDPEYPEEAKAKHIQGETILIATITRDGSVSNLRVLQGDPILVEAAMQAARQWRYKPFLVNGEAVEVETMIRIRFQL